MSSVNLYGTEGNIIGTIRDGESTNTNDYYLYSKDIQGSTTSIVKEDGTLAAAYSYKDFGETSTITDSSIDNEICYTGAILDANTGLYYMNARYYDPETGRFTSEDTCRGEVTDSNQWHLYAYCANDPINYVDPSGHWRYQISRNILGIILDTAISLSVAGIAAKIGSKLVLNQAKEYFKEYLKHKAMKGVFKSKLKSKILGVLIKIYKVKQAIYSKFSVLAESKNSIKSFIGKILCSNILKNVCTEVSSNKISGMITGFIGKVIDYEALDCITSLGGFLAGVIEFDVDGNLDGKIRW